MKKLLAVWSLFILAGASHAGQKLFQAELSTTEHPHLIDLVQARNELQARHIFAARYPGATTTSWRKNVKASDFTMFLAKLSIDGKNIEDTALAKGSGEARRVFESRFPKARIVSLAEFGADPAYKPFEIMVHVEGIEQFRDYVLATSIEKARATLEARYPQARMTDLRLQ